MLDIQHLSKTYKGGKKAVSDLSIRIESGDLYGFIGHNGAGKTTTIKCVVGILKRERFSSTDTPSGRSRSCVSR